MIERETELHRPVLGAEGEPCAVCGAPLAADQRYCLNCGARRADARLPFLDLLTREVVVERPAPAEPPRRGGGVLAVLVAGAAMATLLGLGVLAGVVLAGDDEQQPVAARPPVVNVTVPPATAGAATPKEQAAPAEPVSFTSDWPAGREGWTVQLEALPKDSTDAAAVQAAEDDATAAGAADVGALDSSQHPSLEPGDYIVYSGVYDSRERARDALADLREEFPDAKVVDVGTGADRDAEVQSSQDLEQQEQRTPEEAQKEIRKAPDKLQSEGPAPQEDQKQPGGGSEATEIG
jgi:SPOR domain